MIFLILLSIVLFGSMIVSLVIIKRLTDIISGFEENFGSLYEQIQKSEGALNAVTQNSLFHDSDEIREILNYSKSIRMSINEFFRDRGKSIIDGG